MKRLIVLASICLAGCELHIESRPSAKQQENLAQFVERQRAEIRERAKTLTADERVALRAHVEFYVDEISE